MKTPLLAAAALGLVLPLAACNSEDPNKGGLFGGVGGLSTGNYQRRVDDKGRQVTAEQQRNEELRQQAARSQADERATTAEKAELRRRSSALDADLARLRGQLGSATARTDQGRAELARLRGELDSLQRSNDLAAQDPTLPDAERRRRLDDLTRRKQELERAIGVAVGR